MGSNIGPARPIYAPPQYMQQPLQPINQTPHSQYPQVMQNNALQSLWQLQPQTNSQQSLTSIVLQQQIQALLTQKQNAVLLNPRDTGSRDQIGILTQLLVHVGSSTLTTADLQLISQRLTSMMTPVQAISPTLLMQAAAAAAAAAKPAAPAPIFSPVTPPLSGLIPGFGSANGHDAFSNTKEVSLIRVRLTNSDISRTNRKAYEILYDPSTLQCKQCGMRFPGTSEAGKKRNRAHLDWHFRQNKRMRDKGRRAVCREWYLGLDVWCTEDAISGVDADFDVDAKNAGAAFFGSEDTAASANDSLEASQTDAHDIPADGETDLTCGICTELLEQYCDADDVWMIKNAVKVVGKLYHQSCYSMSIRSGNETSIKRKDGGYSEEWQDMKRSRV
ncbi:hypothetical protein HK100_002757 [Physocladia obscura]|uniref:Pcf11 C-terminal domain-containing protein n=1 Tax=Physocladia obscura TaxID=109957 RepID=A0AAD5SX39_9FUNG|nr:hypothetical protein HK100_002757 [Physocladia obscura]